jgi:hypothetical protein
MLNELYDLWQAGERAGIQFPIRIPGLDEGQNEDGLRVFLRSDGAISRVEAVPGEQMKRIRKWKRGEGSTLPVFNFEPLHAIRLRGSQPISKRFNALSAKARVRFLKRSHSIRWETGPHSRRQKLAGAFKSVSADLIQKVADDTSADGAAWRALLPILQHVTANAFMESLSKAIRDHLGANGPVNDCSLDVLFHSAAKAKAGTTPIQFEPEGQFASPIYSAKAQEWLVGILDKALAADDDRDESVSEEIAAPGEVSRTSFIQSAVWGKAQGAGEKYRDVKLPTLGKVSLFNRDVNAKPTSTRYDNGQAVFRVGPDVRMKLMAAIEWLAADERKGKTWVVRGKPKKEGAFLLLTYLKERMDSVPEHLAEVFTGPTDDDADHAVVQFETLCSGVVHTLDGIPGLSDAAQIKLFALHKPDGFRAQLFASETFTKGRLKSLAHEWQRACRLHPRILIPQFVPQGEEEFAVEEFEPAIPFPYQAIECLNTVWQKCEDADDAKADPASDYDFADAFELLRRTGSHPTDAAYLGRMLDLAVLRALPLLSAVGQSLHQVHHRVFVARGDKGAGTKSRLHARRWPCLLTLLLHRLGYQLNTFMKEPAYLIGRFLAQIDRLHAYYAKHVSGKEDGLRQLIGNSLMSVALESPLRAFELAGQRILPYQAWAEQFSRAKDSYSDEEKRKDAGYVNSILWDLGRISEELSECAIPEVNRAPHPERVGHEAKSPTRQILDLKDTLTANGRAWMHADSAAKSQMLLGYLARPEKKQPPTATAATGDRLPDFDENISPQSINQPK